jgi:hypothetical protein
MENIFFGFLKVTDERSRIQIRTKMSRIPNTEGNGEDPVYFYFSFKSVPVSCISQYDGFASLLDTDYPWVLNS